MQAKPLRTAGVQVVVDLQEALVRPVQVLDAEAPVEAAREENDAGPEVEIGLAGPGQGLHGGAVRSGQGVQCVAEGQPAEIYPAAQEPATQPEAGVEVFVDPDLVAVDGGDLRIGVGALQLAVRQHPQADTAGGAVQRLVVGRRQGVVKAAG